MTHIGSGMFRAALVGVKSGSVVTCHLLATDRAGNQTKVTLKPIKVP